MKKGGDAVFFQDILSVKKSLRAGEGFFTEGVIENVSVLFHPWHGRFVRVTCSFEVKIQ